MSAFAYANSRHKNGSHLEKWVTVGKMGHTCKMGHSLKEGSHLLKWVTLGKMGHSWQNGSLLERMVISGNIGTQGVQELFFL